MSRVRPAGRPHGQTCVLFFFFWLHKYCSRRELSWTDFMKYTFGVVMSQDTCDPIRCKLGMILNTTKLYSQFESSLNDHDVLHKVTGLRERYNLCSPSVVKLHEATKMFVMVDYGREYGKYGSFEHLLPLFCLFFVRFVLFCFWGVGGRLCIYFSWEGQL